MKENVARIAPLFVPLGLLLTLAGLVVGLITRTFDLLTNGLLGAGALLLLAYIVLRPDDIRRRLSGFRARYGFVAFASTLAFAGVALLIYYVAFNNPDWRLDLTETAEFTPLPETVSLLRSVDEPIHAIAYFNPANVGLRQQATDVLESLRAVNERLTYEFRDPADVPEDSDRYQLETTNTLVFTRGEGDDEIFASVAIGGIVNESDVHTALLRVINPVDRTIYFLTGHGERDPDDAGPDGVSDLRLFMQNQGYDIEPLNLFTAGAIPTDAAAIALFDQRSPLRDEEVTLLGGYLEEGGALLVARDVDIDPAAPTAPDTDGLRDLLLDQWGVALRPDIVADVTNGQAGLSVGPIVFLALDFGLSPIIDNDLRQLGMVFEFARSVSSEPLDNVLHTDLVRTSSNSWGESDIANLAETQIAFDAGVDVDGPVAVAVSAENQATGGRLIVIGDADFADNAAVYVQGNYLFASNALSWLVGEESSIALTPRETVDRQIFIPGVQLNLIALLSVCVGPLITLAVGLGVWYRRRRR